MKKIVKSTIKFILKFKFLSKIVVKIYPIATESLFLRSINVSSSREVFLSRYTCVQEYLEINHLPEECYKRYGSDYDGGYFLVDDINPNSKLLSFGVGPDISFEAELSPKLRQVHLYDYSVSALPQNINNSKFFMSKVSTSDTNDKIDVNTCYQILNDSSKETILKCDIEGDELEVVSHISPINLKNTSQIILEIHNLNRIMANDFYSNLIKMLKNISLFHTPVFVNANNWDTYNLILNKPLPNTIEVTFLAKDKINKYKSIKVPSSPKSQPNSRINPSIELNFLP